MILYIFKTILLSSLFYALYYALLRTQKSFRWNSIYLIVISALSAILPFVSFSFLSFNTQQPSAVISEPQAYTHTLQSINVYTSQISNQEIGYGKIIGAILFIGLLWGLLRLTLGFIVLRRSKLNSEIELYKGTRVYYSENIDSPFSFYKQIFIPLSLKNSNILAAVLEHEYTHCRLHHSTEKIYFAALQSLCWFNPFIYLFHKELELLHEYEVDAIVAAQLETDTYVETLLQTLTYHKTSPTLLVHSFFTHPLKTRIIMLYKTSKNAFVHKTSATLLATLLTVAFISVQSVAQQKTDNKQHIPHKSETLGSGAGGEFKISMAPNGKEETFTLRPNFDTLYDVVDVMPEFYGGSDALVSYLTKNLKFPSGTEIKEKKVIVQFIVAKDGHIAAPTVRNMPVSSDLFEKEALRVVEKMPNWKPGLEDGKAADVKMSLPIVFKAK